MSKYAVMRDMALGCLFFQSGVLYADNPGDLHLADVHIQYNLEHAQIIPPAQLIKHLRRQQVTLAWVYSTPSDHVLRLQELAPDLIKPLYSPMITSYSHDSWHRDKRVLLLTEKALESKKYVGIGEIPLYGSIKPDNEILTGLIQLGRKYRMPVYISAEENHAQLLVSLCQNFPDVTLIWTHGGSMTAQKVMQVINTCQNILVDVSFGDSLHLGELADESGKMDPLWRSMLLHYPERFLFGTEPLWSMANAHGWYDDEQGWLHYQEIIQHGRRWLKTLPADVSEKIRIGNARRIFRLTQ